MSPGRELEDLLRRCHRDELLGLARILGIKPAGMGLGTLARAIDRTLRRRGANDLANLVLRRGEGPPYTEMLAKLGRRHGFPIDGPPPVVEETLLRWLVRKAWEEMDLDERERLWEELRMERPAPDRPIAALERVERHHAERLGYIPAGAGFGALAARFFPPLGCLSLWWLVRARDDLVIPAVLEVGRLRHVVLHRVTVGVVGSPSSGKDAAIRAIFGIDTGNIDPVAGSTREVEITRLPGSTALFVVNTPGLGDVVASVTEQARQILDHIDVYLYLVNAQGGVQAREKADYAACLASGRPALAVVNKIDTLREDDRERYLADAREKLGAPPEDFAAAAFDPLPQLSPTPLGVDGVRRWITEHLIELGKEASELPWAGGSGRPVS